MKYFGRVLDLRRKKWTSHVKIAPVVGVAVKTAEYRGEQNTSEWLRDQELQHKALPPKKPSSLHRWLTRRNKDKLAQRKRKTLTRYSRGGTWWEQVSPKEVGPVDGSGVVVFSRGKTEDILRPIYMLNVLFMCQLFGKIGDYQGFKLLRTFLHHYHPGGGKTPISVHCDPHVTVSNPSSSSCCQSLKISIWGKHTILLSPSIYPKNNAKVIQGWNVNLKDEAIHRNLWVTERGTFILTLWG